MTKQMLVRHGIAHLIQTDAFPDAGRFELIPFPLLTDNSFIHYGRTYLRFPGSIVRAQQWPAARAQRPSPFFFLYKG